MFRDLADVERANKKLGNHWFEPATMRFFGTEFCGGLVGGRYFVTSEQPPSGPRQYSVREAMPDGRIETVGQFGFYSDARTAKKVAQALARDQMIEQTKEPVEYIFVVDTEQYSGNFERQLCAFVTGMVGECGVGENESTDFSRDMGRRQSSMFEEQLNQKADEHGCYRPCAIWPTPGWFNHGLGGFFKDGQEIDALYNYREAAVGAFGADSEHAKRDHVMKYPAYLSVAIFFLERPTKKQIDVMTSRAMTFAASEKLNITGFRLIERSKTVTDTVTSIPIPAAREGSR